MKEIIRHNFTKSKNAIACYYCNSKSRKKEKVPNEDCICLSFEREEKTKIFLRPDEALIVAKQLIESVYRITSDYCIRFMREEDA